MSSQTEVRLANLNITGQEDIDLLIEAAKDIQGAAEANFQHMKDKKWYKRLWEIATFSQANIKVTAKNIASLAQMQDIVLKVLLIASKESCEIAQYLADSCEQLRELAKDQTILANAIAKIEYGYDQRPDIMNIPEAHWYVIESAVLTFVNKACIGQKAAPLAQQYLRNLHNSCKANFEPELSGFDYQKIGKLNSDGHKLLAIILCEASILLNDDAEKMAAFDEIIRCVRIALNELDGIKNRTAAYANTMGKEFIAAYYDKANDFDATIIMDGEWVECSENNESDEDTFDADEGNFVLASDDTEKQYHPLRDIIIKYIYKIRTGKRDVNKAGSIKAFVEKYPLQVIYETVVALIDTSIIANGEEGLLFTTHAIYQRIGSKNKAKIAYSEIDYNKCVLSAHDNNGRPTELTIAQKDGISIKLNYSKNINLDLFLDMLIEIGKLKEYASYDSPQPITEMDYTVKLPFAKYLVNFMTYINKPVLEAMHYACDIGFTDEQLMELAQYASGSKEPDGKIILQINDNVPYPSRKSLQCALILEMYNRLYSTVHSLEVPSQAHEFIRKTAEWYGFSSDNISDLNIVSQTLYKIIDGQIKSIKELQPAGDALKRLVLAGHPISTLIGSLQRSRLEWLMFIPFPFLSLAVGMLLMSAFGVGYAVIDKLKTDAEFVKQKDEMIDDEARNRAAALRRLSRLFPGLFQDN